MQQTGSHRQNYRLWEQQEVLQERRRLRSEELFPRVMAASVCLKDSAKDHTQLSDTAAPDHQQHFNFQALPKGSAAASCRPPQRVLPLRPGAVLSDHTGASVYAVC